MSQSLEFYQKNQTNIFGLLLGALFGYLMSQAGATTFDFHAKLFLFEDFQLLKVFGTAVTVGVIGVLLLKKYQVNAIVTGQAVDFVKKPYKQGLIAGAVLFGIGWGLTASCPGSVPIMIGEGKIGAYFTLIGLVLGTLSYGLMQSKLSKTH